MQIKTLVLGNLQTNCYLVTDETTLETLIVDPADEADFISTTILENKLLPKAIILTHGHYDHCLGALELKLNFSLLIYLHNDDHFLYQKAHQSARYFSRSVIPKLPPIDHYLTDKEEINFGVSKLEVIHTPGHTPGSICLYGKNHLFTGDTLFLSGKGKADKSYSSKTDLEKSISNLSKLPDTTLVYPGHENFRFFLPEALTFSS